MEAEESKNRVQFDQKAEDKSINKPQSRFQQKFIKIISIQERLAEQKERESEKGIGPINFKPIMKLGSGSFGDVFLVQKIKEGMKETDEPQYFALKILDKDKVLQNNLVRYAKTERDVLTYTKHPFIVGLNYAF